MLILAWYSIYIWQHKKYSDFFDTLDGIIEQSKLLLISITQYELLESLKIAKLTEQIHHSID